MNNIILIGSEEVGNAGRNIKNAADQMEQAATSYADCCRSQQEFMNQWLDRLKQTLDDHRRIALTQRGA